ncbi:MAG: FAD:protein FMN transferase [Acidimicrobiales bacterium]
MNFNVWGMSGTLVTESAQLHDFASERLTHWLNAIDAACNRFRDDSELSRLNARGESVMSATFELALVTAVEAWRATQGLCDPTVLPALQALGYDADFADVVRRRDLARGPNTPSPGASAVSLDETSHRVSLAPGCQVDLGASAKALAVDLIADDVAPRGGVLVEIGGDVALRGPGPGPEGAWSIGVSDDLIITGHEPRVSLTNAGVATSSTRTRAWRAGGQRVHHIIDPRSGAPTAGPYLTATVAAESCRRANAFATAALIWGDEAPYHLAQAHCAARLVRDDGTVDYVGGWPVDQAAA